MPVYSLSAYSALSTEAPQLTILPAVEADGYIILSWKSGSFPSAYVSWRARVAAVTYLCVSRQWSMTSSASFTSGARGSWGSFARA